MKIIALTLLLFIIINSSYAQKPDGSMYHIHRAKLENTFYKFTKEKAGRVAFLGGSITFNPGWRDSISKYLQIKFPETGFDFINAGIPSMGSTPGAFRFERDVLKNGKVDLLFVEAAVNDDTNRRSKEEIIRGMEGIIRHAKTANPYCDIIMMHFVDPGKMQSYRSGKVPEVIELHEKVAKHYHISSINLAKEVTDRIDAGEFDWETDFKNLHPSPFGQNIYYQSIIQFLDNACENCDLRYTKSDVGLIDPLDNFSYSKGRLIEPKPNKKIKGWKLITNWKPDDKKGTRANYTNVPMLEGKYPGEIIKFHFKGNAVGIAVAAGPDAGMIEYSIDNSPWQKQDLFTSWSSGLHLPWYFTLSGGLKNKNHVLQLRLIEEKNPKSTGSYCRIRYFYMNK